jgi:hypothetical protein
MFVGTPDHNSYPWQWNVGGVQLGSGPFVSRSLSGVAACGKPRQRESITSRHAVVQCVLQLIEVWSLLQPYKWYNQCKAVL